MLDRLFTQIIDSVADLIGSGIKLIPAFLSALVILAVTRYAAELTDNVADRLSQKAVKSLSLQHLIVKLASITTWVIGALLAAVIAFPGLNLGDIIGTLGLSSVAIGFAFQDIFKNFLAGILLLLQEPFRIGDQIAVGDYEGTVERVDIRTTTLRTYQGEEVLLPNADVFSSAVQVRTAFENRRTDLAVGVDYHTSLSDAIDLLQGVLSQVESVVNSPHHQIDVVGFGDSSIDFLVRYWTKSDQASVCRAQTEVMLAIKTAFDAADISIPYPIRTLYFYNQDRYNDHLSNSDAKEHKPALPKG